MFDIASIGTYLFGSGGLPKVQEANAAEVTIEGSPEPSQAALANASPNVVFTSDSVGYVFYINSAGACGYRKTSNGGTNWSGFVQVDQTNSTDCISIAVWYDRWTPGDEHGNSIHVATADIGTDDTYYTLMDLAAAGGPKASTTVVTTSQGTTGFTIGANWPSVTKATNGDIYVGGVDTTDSWVVRCAATSTCTTAGNWFETHGGDPWTDGDNDNHLLMPLPGGKIMAMQMDSSADTIQTKVYSGGVSGAWDAGFVTVDNTASDNGNYPGQLAATLDKTTGTIYMAYARDISTLGINDDIYTWRYEGGTWTQGGNIITDNVGIGGNDRSPTSLKLSFDENNGVLYAIYTARTTAGSASTGNIYYLRSFDRGSSWGTESSALNASAADLLAVSVNIMSKDYIYAYWDIGGATDDLQGNTVVNLSAAGRYSQQRYRWRADNNNEATASFLTNEDTPYSNAGVASTTRLRLLLDEVTVQATTTVFNLEYATSTAGTACGTATSTGDGILTNWQPIQKSAASSTSYAWRMAASPQFLDGGVTTDVANGLTNPISGTGSSSAGQIKDKNATTTGISVGAGNFVELEWALTPTGDINTYLNGQSYCFRARQTATTTNFSYFKYAKINLATSTIQQHFRWLANNVSGTESASFKVGSFTKATGAAPASQAVAHGLGTTPKAIIFWTEGETAESLGTNHRFGAGLTDGTTSRSVCEVGLGGGIATSNTSVRQSTTAICFMTAGESLLAEASVSSIDSTNINLSWTTNNATAYVVHYIAIGGSNVSAKVVEWRDKNNGPGTKEVTGVGFKPDFVYHIYADDDNITGPPENYQHAAIGMGAMNSAGEQWANIAYSRDNVSGGDTQRYQTTSKVITKINQSLTVDSEASFTSMDSDGFTVTYATVNNPGYNFSLAIKNINTKIGSFTKTADAAPVNQSVTGVGFQPSLLFLSSVQDTSLASPDATSRYGVGATDGTTQGTSAFHDADTTNAIGSIDKTSKVFDKVTDSTTEAEATISSFDTGGFTLNWGTNDAVATQILYFAMSDSSGASFLSGEDTAVTGAATASTTRLRFLAGSSGATKGATTTMYQLEYATSTITGYSSCANLQAWVPVGKAASSSPFAWKMSPSARFQEGAITIDSAGLTNPSMGTFASGTIMEFQATTSPPVYVAAGNFTELEWSIEATSYAEGDSYCFRITNADSTVNLSYSKYARISMATTSGAAVYIQRDFKIYHNTDALNPTTAWDSLGLNESLGSGITRVSANTTVRLRMNLTISTGSLSASEQSFLLQYAPLPSGSTCASLSSGSWVSVGSKNSAGPVFVLKDNSFGNDTAITSLLLSSTEVAGMYTETNPSTVNSNGASTNQEIEYDWPVMYPSSTHSDTTFCFRMVKNGGAVLSSYTNYPQLVTNIIGGRASNPSGNVGIGEVGGGSPAGQATTTGGTGTGGSEQGGSGSGAGSSSGGGSGGGSEVFVPGLYGKFASIWDSLLGVLMEFIFS